MTGLVDEARELGVPNSLIRKHMNDEDRLAEIIESFNTGKAHVKEVRRKMTRRPVARAKAKAKAETSSRRPNVRQPRKSATVAEKPKRGRPVGSKNKPKQTTAASRQTKRQTAKATQSRRQTTVTRKPRVTKHDDSVLVGRNVLGKVNFSKTDGWNPREHSITDDIWHALKQAKGDRAKAFTILLGWAPLGEWVSRNKSDGTKRTKDEQESMLRYRIARTLWDFANQTGQHETNENFGKLGNSKPKPKQTTSRRRTAPANGRRKAVETAKPARGRKVAARTAKTATGSARRRPTAATRRRTRR